MTDLMNVELLKTQDFIGKPVISLQGEELGTIARVLVDPVEVKVVGFTVNVKGWFKGEKGMEFASVHSFGDYAVTVQRDSQVVAINSLPAIEKIAQECNMYNMRIITPDGRLVGTIDDFYFDPGTGMIKRYLLSGGIIKNLYKGRASIPAESIEKIGKDVIIAAVNVEDTMQKESGGLEENIDNLKEDIDQWKTGLEDWKDDFETIWEKTRTKALDLSKTVGDNLKEAAKSSKGKGKEILSKTGEILNEKGEQLKKSYESWMNRLQQLKTVPEKPLSKEDLTSLVGLKAGKTVTGADGTIIVAENKKVTKKAVEMAQKENKIKELLISVATRDLEDQIKSIEQDSGKQP